MNDHEGTRRLARREALQRLGLIAGTAVVGGSVLAACTDDSPSAAGTVATAPPGTQGPTLERPDTPDEVDAALREGNQRYIDDAPLHPNRGSELRASTESVQRPFAAVLSCADSRVEPALIFDQGIGDLFVVSNAGNLADPTALASLAYGVDPLGVDVIIVLGHGDCGAVSATVAASEGTAEPSEFDVLTDAIAPAVTESLATGLEPGSAELTAASIRENVMLQASLLTERSAIIRQAVDEGRLDIVPAMYELASGRVVPL